ncbi:hypothetical protein EI94DRAFT_1704552 [Lactarius quietus]|nr:hypothetical protein EI94DRAFT_1704552 [Lactarius quietus]
MPSSMDIYDTVKQKAPSQADIQTQLIMEEEGDHSVHGQTSWICVGSRFRKCTSEWWFSSHTGGATSDRKQADGFLLHHGLMDNMSIPSLADYAEYDHIDDIDYFRVTAIIAHTSNPSGSDGPHSEDIPTLLPSTIGWQWCASHGVKSLALKEAKLFYAQATDSIHAIRLALGFKSALFQTLVRDARTQQTKTRAWKAIQNVDTTVHQHAQNYRMVRDAYENIKNLSQTSPELTALAPTNLQVNTAILGAAQKGQQNKQLSWIWSFGISGKKGWNMDG